MKKIILITVVSFFASSAMAWSGTRNLDIINNSDLPVKITYNVCTQSYVDDAYGHIMDKENCAEQIVTLSRKGEKRNKVSVKADSDDSTYREILVTGIYSTLATQKFASSRTEINKATDISVCSDSKNMGSARPVYAGNTIILDNMGTEKIYCSINDMSS